MTGAQEGAEVIPFERGGVPAVKEDYVEAIQLWCQTRDTAEALSREEIGAMDWTRRMDAQRKALILGFAQYFRQHERADVAPGVLLVLTLLSDNEHGAAQISQETMAKLFGRSRTAIYQAQSRLKEAQLIVTGRGRHSRTYPVIPRVLTGGYNHLTWLISAIAQDTSNCKDPASNSQLLRQPDQLVQLPSPAYGLKEVNCQDEPISIAKAGVAQLLTKNNSTVVDRAAAIAAAVIASGAVSLPAAATPSEPPSIIQSAKAEISGKELIDKLQDAGGRALNLTKPIFHIAEVPRNWMAAGCDLETDILPTIRAMVINKPVNSIHAWKYFEAQILGARDARRAPLAGARAPKSDWRSANASPYKERSLLSDEPPPQKLRPRCEVET